MLIAIIGQLGFLLDEETGTIYVRLMAPGVKMTAPQRKAA